MPIGKQFSRATESNIKRKVPETAGVYELKNWGEVVYIGSSNNLQERLLTHLSEREPNGYRYKEVSGFLSSHTKAEQEHYDRHVEKHGKPPQWNDRRP